MCSQSSIRNYCYVVLGSSILAFGLYNLNYQNGIAEGGILGLSLLLKNFFNFSPAIVGFFCDTVALLFGLKYFGKSFFKYSLVSTTIFSVVYGLIEQSDPLIPPLTNTPILASLLAGLFVGIGGGLIIKAGGVSGCDDTLAIMMSKSIGVSIGTAFIMMDAVVLLLSTSYLALSNLVLSIITVCTSSFIVNLFCVKQTSKQINEQIT